MQQQQIPHLPLYPEERSTSRPTAEQIFRLFSLLERHQFQIDGENIHRFEPQLTDLQREVLRLLEIPETIYRAAP